MSRLHAHLFLTAALFLALPGFQPLAAQTLTESQFIGSVDSAIAALTASLGAPSHPIVISGNLVYADGRVVARAPLAVLLKYVDGLKAVGAQRIDLNPGVTSLSDPTVMANLDAVVTRIRQLGLQLAINPEITPGELGTRPSFQDFQTAALQGYQQLAARYQPDNFVIVHEPTTATASLGLSGTTVAQWHGFILAAAPLIKAVSPGTRLGAGAFQNGVLSALSAQENAFFQDAVTIPVLDFMTMDVYNDDTFPTYQQWISLARANSKAIYMEETFAPHYLPNPLPSSLFNADGYLTESLDDVAVEGVANPDFASIDASWLNAMALFASANGMEAVTPFNTEVFFTYGTAGHDQETDGVFTTAVIAALAAGHLSSAGQAWLADSPPFAVRTATSLSSASYPVLSSVFTPNCGTAAAPCNANDTVAPDSLVSAFGADLSTTTAGASSASLPASLGGTSITLVDSSGAAYPVPLSFVAPGQVNYMLPSAAKIGPARLTITSGDGAVTTGIILIAPVAPGVYSANANGQGVAAALALTQHADQSQSVAYAFTCGAAPGSCVPQPISLGSSTDTVYLELYATGLRHVSSSSAVTVAIGNLVLPVAYVGPQNQYPGLDQVNVQLPRSLAASGVVKVVVMVQDAVNNVTAAANTVTIAIQ